MDYFDDETAFKILKDHGFSDEDSRYAVDYAGGVPWILELVISRGLSILDTLYRQTLSKIHELLKGRKDLKEVLNLALKGENLIEREDKKEEVQELVGSEVLFYDPINMLVGFQTKLHERAAREILGVN